MVPTPFQPQDVPRSSAVDDLQVFVLPILMDNYAYVLAWGDEAAVVDPGEAGPVQRFLEERGLRLSLILNTHHHGDHVEGNEDLKGRWGCKVVGPDDPRIPGLDRAVADGDRVVLGRNTLQVLATPGHGSSDISFYRPRESHVLPGSLWTGDALFCGGCGRLFEGSPGQMWDSLSKLAGLPDDTHVYCGHEYTEENLAFALTIEPGNRGVAERLDAVKALRRENRPTVPSTIGLERMTNPFLRAGCPVLREAMGMPDAEAVEVFTALRAKKDRF